MRGLFSVMVALIAPVTGHAVERKNAATVSISSSAIMIDGDDRLTPADYARANRLSTAQLATRFGATGIVSCGGAVGTGQLVGADNVVVTAAHVLFAPDGKARASSCVFALDAGGRRQVVELRLDGVISGSRSPYAFPAIRDWAVAPLAAPVAGAHPYRLARTMKVPGAIVLAAAARGTHENPSLQDCRARQVTAEGEGMREVAIDCDAEGGASGAALLDRQGDFLGVYVGFRSTHPGTAGPFSMQHYNFGVTADGDLRQAVTELVNRGRQLSANR
ncbi:S1 family peptidase [Ancylobacter mangrovi]|uniref:S1 family peptidase n=1 Tax=Ancylobacter mangrovi TaxID=2972472 RepID=UPI0021622D29|nr:serine protease [Ancylobacter mangrovi]MCS0504939.1 serine protease [Ancylobacter mangrovi]